MRSFGKFLVLLPLLVLTIVYSASPQSAPFKADLTFQAVLGALGGIFIIVLLVERVTEIAITIWRQTQADSLKQEIDSLSKDAAKAADLLAKSKEFAIYQAETKGIALLISFSISVIVCSAGIGLLSTIIDTSRAGVGFIRGTDILLTSGLIAGGSDAFHKFVSALETFFSESKKSMEKRT
jgi:hypothetical protein